LTPVLAWQIIVESQIHFSRLSNGGNVMKIGVGILGFAHGHVNAYCTQWQQHPEYEIKVVAGWDHDAARLESARKQFDFQPCNAVEEVLSRADVQAVVISSETSLHAGLVEQAAAAGKMIVLQKPIALTLSEADRIVSAVQRHGVAFTMAWQMRVDPQNIKIKEMMQSEALGKIFIVRRRHGLSTQISPGFTDLWHVRPELNRDIWADDAAHAIDFLYWLLGQPETVTAEMDSLLDPRIPMDNGIAVFRYPGGPFAEVSCSFTCIAAENTTEVFAEKGSIIQNYGDVPSCNVPRLPETPGLKWYLHEQGSWTYSDIASPSAHYARIAGLSGPLSDFFHGRRPPIATAEEGRTVLRMTLACYISTREGRRVRIDEDCIRLV
jgi:predicted dehydrogenase